MTESLGMFTAKDATGFVYAIDIEQELHDCRTPFDREPKYLRGLINLQSYDGEPVIKIGPGRYHLWPRNAMGERIELQADPGDDDAV